MPISFLASHRGRFVRGMLSLAAIFLFCLSYWIHRYFGQVDIHQIAYHLNFGLDIARSSDPVFTKRFVRWCGSLNCTNANVAGRMPPRRMRGQKPSIPKRT